MDFIMIWEEDEAHYAIIDDNGHTIERHCTENRAEDLLQYLEQYEPDSLDEARRAVAEFDERESAIEAAPADQHNRQAAADLYYDLILPLHN